MSAYDDSGYFAPWPALFGDAANDGYLAAPRPQRRPPFDATALIDALPRLGSVLWLHRPREGLRGERLVAGAHGLVALEDAALHGLATCIGAEAHNAVTPCGPREWLCLRERGGEVCAKLFLLPDTDYLAWDEMAARAGAPAAATSASRWNAHTAFLRSALARLGSPWRAQLGRFELQGPPWRRGLRLHRAHRLSVLDLELALAIARDEGAELAPTSPPF